MTVCFDSYGMLRFNILLSRDTRFDAQRTKNTFTTALRAQIRWLSFGNEANLFERWHPLRPLMRRWNARQMVQYVSQELDNRFVHNRKNKDRMDKERSKTIIDLALEKYLADQARNRGGAEGMDETFKNAAICQIRTFLFAGHDTSSSTLCYCYHLLSLHPHVRRSMVDELDKVLGEDVGQAASRIAKSPHLLNQLTYTFAIIKETLRLYPPASSTRSGEPGFTVASPDGRQCPTEGLLVWSNSVAIHRNPDFWPQPNDFLPERWLVDKSDPLFPAAKGMWRAFEYGPRNCIGQELALLEVRLILALTVREFSIESAYDKWDRLKPPKGPKTVNGDRAYQILLGAAHPNDGFPCKVSINGK